MDSLGLESRYPFQVTFAAEENNAVPQVDGVHIIEREDGRVVIAVEASDGDGDELQISVDWGDGASTQGVAGRFFSHEYTITTDRTYGVTVTAVDPRASDVGRQRLYSSLCKMTSPLNLRG